MAVGGLVPQPVRALVGREGAVGQALSAETIAKAAAQVSQDLGSDILGDIYASAEYRRAVAPVWVKRALTAAHGSRIEISDLQFEIYNALTDPPGLTSKVRQRIVNSEL